MRFSLSLATLLAVAGGPSLFAQAPVDRPLPPKDAAKAMTLPPGFKATLFAGEPDVVQPIAMTFDDRGRLWVVECLSYPNWTTKPEGNDRVLIFEDTNHDGTFDKRTVFFDKGANLSGIEFGFGGIWLCASPNLIFLADRDGDDKPDGPPEVVLDGWNMKDTKHNIFNSLAWGPDGWLYGCNGIQAKARVGKPGTPDKDRVGIDCGVWRYHPTRKIFEAYAHGTTNPFGLDWDDYGQLFITNCVIDHMWHVLPGAHFQRMYGEDLNPYTFGLMKSCVDHLHWGGGSWTSSRNTGSSGGKVEHSEAGGGHAHSGCMVYLGDNFPPEYRNNVFLCNIHGNRLNRDRLERTPGEYVAKHEKDFLFANDAWFRGLMVKQGPDGSIFVSDWTDTGECHNYKVVDQENGRIYKVGFGTLKPWTGDVSRMADAALVQLQASPNEWLVRHARRVLQERAVKGSLEEATPRELRALLHHAPAAPQKLRAAWALHAIGKLSDGDVSVLFRDADPAVRSFAAVLGLDAASPSKVAGELAANLGADSSMLVRRVLAGVLHRLTGEHRAAAVASLLAEPVDRETALMIWYGVQPGVLTDPTGTLALARTTKIGLVREAIVRCFLTRPGVDTKAALDDVVKLLNATADDTARKEIIGGIQLTIAGRRDLTPPAGWVPTYAKLQRSTDPGVRHDSEALAVQFGDAKALKAVRARLTDTTIAADERRTALQLLVSRKVPDLAPTLRTLLGDPAVRATALRSLSAYADAETPTAILTVYPSLAAAEKADAVQTLASRPAFANALLDAVEKGTLPRTDIPVVAARQMFALNDKALTARLTKVWGVINPVGKNRAALLAKWKPQLDVAAIKKANAANGRAVFTKSCAACHKIFGEGGEVGPDLTGSQRANLDYVLENVLDPNAVVAREYQLVNFTLADGRSMGGIVQRETADSVTVRTVNETVVISKGDIETRKQTSQSIMPEGLFDAMKPEEVRDLIAYLASPQQVNGAPK